MVLRVISRLLDYPSQELFSYAYVLVKVVNESKQLSDENRKRLADFILDLTRTDLYDAQERYDLLFDRGRALSLLLFEHVHGESKDRGQAMVNLMSEYTSKGFELSSRQLPDYIPLYLEFLSEQDEAYAGEWLADISHILTILSERLLERKSRYRVLFDALIELSGATVDRDKVAKAVRQEQPDDTMEAIDKAWKDEEIRFDDPAQPGCGQSSGCSLAINPSREASAKSAALSP